MLNVAIIGLGTISGTHIDSIERIDSARLCAVCDIDKSRGENYPGINFYTDYVELLELEKPDCVHICLPHHLHVEVAISCAKKGVHVFTEKPVAISYNEAEKLFDIEKQTGVKVGVCLQNRYNNTVMRLKEIVNEGGHGKFLGSKGLLTWYRPMSYYEEAPWRGVRALAGSGVLLNQAIHTLDLLYYLVDEFSSVEAKVANFSVKQTEIEDSVMARLGYKNEGNAFFFATTAYRDNSSVELELIFEEATFKIADEQLYIRNKSEREWETICNNSVQSGEKSYYGSSHFTAISKFYQAIEQNTNDYISVVQAAHCIKVVDAMFLSSQTGEEILI